MNWKIKYTKEAEKDFFALDNSLQLQVSKGIDKLSKNPQPRPKGLGKPLSNTSDYKLAGCCKIKLKSIGYRVVYKLEYEGNIMKIIVISIREDSKVYKIANDRLNNV